MYCNHCGAELAGDSLFCRRCGRGVAGANRSQDVIASRNVGARVPPATPPKLRSLLWVFSPLLLLAFFTIVLRPKTNNNEKTISSQTATTASTNTETHVGAEPKEKNVISDGKTEERDEYGATALIRATINGDTATVRKLIVNGADVNGRGSSGWTPLMYAVNNGHIEVARVLLVKGADVNAEASNGHTALMSIDKGAGMAQVLLAAGANVNAQRKDGMTALMIATVSGNEPVVKALLAKGADVNARVAATEGSFGGWTALDFAEWKGDSSVVGLLANHSGATSHK
jgi:ankyrin repeat protein